VVLSNELVEITSPISRKHAERVAADVWRRRCEAGGWRRLAATMDRA
jgi:hypothetical protein